MRVIAIDPGNEKSALVIWDGARIVNARWEPNEFIRRELLDLQYSGDPLVIEKIASFGMPVGAEVFETVYWSGIFAESYGRYQTHRLTRITVKNHLCHSSRAKDGNIRQALIDRFGAPGTKKVPGLLYGVSGDLWAALAVAVTWWDQNCASREVA